MKFCKHEPHTVINWIKSPKWSTNEVLIARDAVDSGEKNILVEFTDPSPQKKYGWFWLDRDEVRKSPNQRNGRTVVYVVSMNKRKPFTPIKDCDCDNLKLL